MTLILRAALLAAFLVPFTASAQKFEPQVGQAGKDVIWVPTPDEVVERMLTMAQTGPNDIHFDLGAGDGKIAIMAAKKFGAKATGIQYNPGMGEKRTTRAPTPPAPPPAAPRAPRAWGRARRPSARPTSLPPTSAPRPSSPSTSCPRST